MKIPESLNLKSYEIINNFLGERSWVVETYSSKPYYAKLLAWTVKCIIKSRGWKIMSVQGCNYDEPVIRDIQIDYTKFESCVTDGQFLLEKNNIRLVIILNGTNSVQIETTETHRRLVKAFIRAIWRLFKEAQTSTGGINSIMTWKSLF